MLPQETPPLPFDPEKFRIEFVSCLTPNNPPETAIQMMADVIRQNPDRIDEICKIASTALKAAAGQQSSVVTEMSHEHEIDNDMENQLRTILKEILHHILDSIKKDDFRRDVDQLGHKSSWSNLNSWIVVENCENGFGLPNRSRVGGLMTKLLIKESADDTYGPFCGIQITIHESRPNSKLHGFIIVKLVHVGDEDIIEISSCSVDGFATVVGPTKDTIENHGGDYRIYNIGDINPEEWDVVDKKILI